MGEKLSVNREIMVSRTIQLKAHILHLKGLKSRPAQNQGANISLNQGTFPGFVP